MLPFENIISTVKKITPKWLLSLLLPFYHWLWAFGSAVYYRFPGKKLKIAMITGTKGKSTTAELINTLLEAAGHKTALASTLRFKIGNKSQVNKYKMSVPGRGVIHKFLRDALDQGCDWVVMEMTSQAVLQSRHKYIYPNAIIFTNLEPEHIEAHGSYENYREAKLQIADELLLSNKKDRLLVVNSDDVESELFIKRVNSDSKINQTSFGVNENDVNQTEKTLEFKYKNTNFTSPLQGKFNLYNVLGAITFAETMGVSLDQIKSAIRKFSSVRGRLEKIPNDQNIDVYVDYAHTPGSLKAVYKTFPTQNKICVLGNTGGGRDTWKRAEMARIAENYCEQIILTDEDPYDEDPREIVNMMVNAITNKDKLTVNMDRRQAISEALKTASNTSDSVVLITGKGTDPYIMRANNMKEPWDDATVVREELEKLETSE